MALPLKSGADLYNNQALRMRLHNLGADPTEVGAGLIYFNTSSGLNTSQKARLYTGSAWKTIAFSEDLDVASNADFLALKERVDLLSGDVDTDNLINNIKDLEEFLRDFDETDKLKSLLDGKLNTSGGTINGNLLIGAPDNTSYRYLQFARSGYGSRLNIADGNLYVSFGGIDANGGLTATKSLSIGNNGLRFSPDQKTYYDILTSAGGTIDGDIKINSIDGTPALIYFSVANSGRGALGCAAAGPVYYDVSNNGHDILHSGNVGEYALKTDGSNEMTGALLLNHTNPRIAFMAGGKTYGSLGYFADGLKWYVNSENAYHAIAFTDSTVAAANVLMSKTGVQYSYNFNTDKIFVFGNGAEGYKAYIDGSVIALRYGSNNATGFILNSSGNVTIGASDLAGTSTKLYVDGHIKLGASGYLYKNDKTVIDFAGDAPLFGYGTAAAGLGTKVYGFDISLYYGGTTNVGFILNSSGNVLIGTTTDNGAKLQVNGDLHVSGNIIADGEVSAGGAAEEGGNAGSGGAFHSESIAVGATQTTIAHGLGTDDIVVSIYEKDGVSGRWSIILTDVEIVDANNIIVSFGSATSVEHKVVIMGAVA